MQLSKKFIIFISLMSIIYIFALVFFIKLLLNNNMILLNPEQKAIGIALFIFIVINIIFAIAILLVLYFSMLSRLEDIQQLIINRKSNLTKLNLYKNNQPTKKSHIEKIHTTTTKEQILAHKKDYNKNDKLAISKANQQKDMTKGYLSKKNLVSNTNDFDNTMLLQEPATILPDRVFFNETLNKAINHAQRHNKILAIVLIDFDHFRKVTSTFGDTISALYLREMGHRFMSILRAGDVITRLGGDEFIILLNDIIHPKFAGPVAEKLLRACLEPVQIENNTITTTASIGITIFPDDGQSLEDLQKHADTAMYKAKQTGGGIYQYYQEKMDVVAHEHYKFDTALRNAVKEQQFVLFYQPQLNLETGMIRSVEALIRWEHPELGLLSPEEFIPLAEETGQIIEIGEWALREACRTNKSWQDAGYKPITVAVNISPQQFRQKDLVEVIIKILDEYKLDAKYLELEITESMIVKDIDLVVGKLNQISKMGVHIAIDDFGTGYTSINYLKQFPITVLKIDQGFIKGIPHNQNDLAITTAIIKLAHSLGLQVVAEGVESIEQIQFLAENNCDLIQGYFLSRPLPSGKIILQFSKK